MFIPTAANNFGNAFANGETVTQEIADYCATEGHGTWNKDGVDQHMCPRCGHTEAAAPKRAPRFNPFKRATEAQKTSRRDSLVLEHGEAFKIDLSGQTLRVECRECGASYTAQPELFIELHPAQCTKR